MKKTDIIKIMDEEIENGDFYRGVGYTKVASYHYIRAIAYGIKYLIKNQR